MGGECRRRCAKRSVAKCVDVVEGMFSGETGTVVSAYNSGVTGAWDPAAELSTAPTERAGDRPTWLRNHGLDDRLTDLFLLHKVLSDPTG